MAAKDEGTRARRDTHPVTQDETPAGTGGRRTRRQTQRPAAAEPTPRAPSEQPTDQATTPPAETVAAPASTQRARRGSRSARTAPGPRGRRRPGNEAEPRETAAATVEPAAAAVLEDEMAPVEAVAEAAAPPAAATDGGAAPPEPAPESAAVPALAAEQTRAAAPPDEYELARAADGGTAGSEEPAAGPEAAEPEPASEERPRRDRHRVSHSNALGALIERHFSDPASPCRSYSDLERHSGISREALSRYVTARPDRRRSPTIDTLVAIADAMHLSLEAVCRAAAASVKGVQLPPEQEQAQREEVLGTLVAALTPEQFGAVVELLRQLRPMPESG